MLPKFMHLFADDARRSSRNPLEPPNVISAKALDKNFRACLPVDRTGSNAPYKIIADEQGWKIEPVLILDVCENGQPRKIAVFGQRLGAEDEE
jgi:hypothetical protein